MCLFRHVSFGIGIAGLIALAVATTVGDPRWARPATVVAAAGLAIGFGSRPALRPYQFTAWILAGVVTAMIYPAYFLQLGPVNLRDKTLILLIMQLVMFGMGTQMRLRDFLGIARMPHAVVIGVMLQFAIMPLVGFSLANWLGFSPEVAAGIVLIGSCSSGLASNVMTFIAKANLPLSITLTSITTMLAPIATPTWMKLLAGKMIPVDFLAMMMEIIKLVIVPIGAAMLADYLENCSVRARQRVIVITGAAGAMLVPLLLGRADHTTGGPGTSLSKVAILIEFLLGSIVAGVLYYSVKRAFPQIMRVLPMCSMIGIVYVTSVTVAAGRDRLLVIGPLLLVAVIAHNSIGYTLGYWLSRAFKLDKNSARTVAIEVGLQNGGMATAIAASFNQLATLGLAAAVFNPWMNVSGSILANYWRKRPVEKTAEIGTLQDDVVVKRST